MQLREGPLRGRKWGTYPPSSCPYGGVVTLAVLLACHSSLWSEDVPSRDRQEGTVVEKPFAGDAAIPFIIPVSLVCPLSFYTVAL